MNKTILCVIVACVLIAADVSSKPIDKNQNVIEDIANVIPDQDAVIFNVPELPLVRTKRQIMTAGDCPTDKVKKGNLCVDNDDYK